MSPEVLRFRMREWLEPDMLEIISREALAVSSGNCHIVPAGLGEEIGNYTAVSLASLARSYGLIKAE